MTSALPIMTDYVSTVPQTGRVTAISDTSVAVSGDNGFVRQYAATPETIAVSADRAESLHCNGKHRHR